MILRPIIIIYQWLCLAALPLVAQDELKLVGNATIRFAGLLSICDFELHSSEPYRWADDPWDKPIRIRIQYHRSISSERLIQTAEKALREEHEYSVIQQFEQQTAVVHKALQDVDKGDIYELHFEPPRNLSLYFNGDPTIVLQDEHFPKYYLSIWLGSNKVASQIKQKLQYQAG